MLTLLSPHLTWLDRAPGHYWGVVIATGLLVLASALAALFGPRRWAGWNRPGLFAVLLGLALFAFRWPMLFDNAQDANPDESQMIAGAIVLKTSPVFWQSVDGTTHGPLVQWPLAALGAAGMPLDFTHARIFSAAMMWVVLVCTWLTLAVVFGDGLARVLVLPASFLVISARAFDFFQYTSEHVPLALIALATWLLARETLSPSGRRGWRLGLAGVLLGALPFAKLQSTPIGLWLGASGLVLVWMDGVANPRARWKRMGWLVGGALVVPAAMLAMILGNGIWRDFWDAYIAGNLMYAKTYQANWLIAPLTLCSLVTRVESLPAYFFPMLWLLFAALWARGGRWRGSEGRLAVWTLGGLLVAVYAILAPDRAYMHYLQFGLAPLALATGAVCGHLWSELGRPDHPCLGSRWRPGQRTLVGVFLAAGLFFQVEFCRVRPMNVLGRFTATHGRLSRPPAADILIKLTTPQDTFALWGWEPRLYVETNRRHATREAHSALQIYASDMRAFYRERYLADLKRAAPPFFVDAVGPGNFAFQDRTAHAHETFDQLDDYVRANYEFVADLAGTRIYARHDRVQAAKKLAAEFR